MRKLLKFQGRWVIVDQRLSASNEWQTIINKSYIKWPKLHSILMTFKIFSLWLIFMMIGMRWKMCGVLILNPCLINSTTCFKMPETYGFAGDAVTLLGLVGVVSTGIIVVLCFTRYFNSPLRKWHKLFMFVSLMRTKFQRKFLSTLS